MLEKSNPILTYEGETEGWYFEWLRDRINECDERCANLCFQSEKTLTPDRYAKQVTSVFEGRKWYHIVDKETTAKEHVAKFENGLKSLKAAKSIRRTIKFMLGYSNVSFELWLLLHKKEFSRPLSNASDYWPEIKRVFGLKDVSNFDSYKHEKNFKKVLNQLTLEDVKLAISRARTLMNANAETDKAKKFSGFEFYDTNPSLSIHLVVEDILKDVGLSEICKTAK